MQMRKTQLHTHHHQHPFKILMDFQHLIPFAELRSCVASLAKALAALRLLLPPLALLVGCYRCLNLICRVAVASCHHQVHSREVLHAHRHPLLPHLLLQGEQGCLALPLQYGQVVTDGQLRARLCCASGRAM